MQEKVLPEANKKNAPTDAGAQASSDPETYGYSLKITSRYNCCVKNVSIHNVFLFIAKVGNTFKTSKKN